MNVAPQKRLPHFLRQSRQNLIAYKWLFFWVQMALFIGAHSANFRQNRVALIAMPMRRALKCGPALRDQILGAG